MSMKFGNVITEQQLTDTTSSKTIRAIRDGVPISDKVRYEERIKVGGHKEAQATIAELALRIQADEDMLDPAWLYEGVKYLKARGHFYVIFCYTKFTALR